MELRTELLAVSCVGDFISCQPRLLKFNNISNIIHDTENNAVLSSLGDHVYLKWIAKIFNIKIFRVHHYIKFYLRFYLDSPFILIIVVVRVASFL